MDMSGPIVIGYDASPDADLALTWGMQTAERIGAAVRVLVASPDGKRHGDEARAQQAASRARDAITRDESTPAEVVVAHGEALPLLMAEAPTARFLVVGSRGHNRIEAQWLGSVSQHLAGHADCPVAVVRPTNNPRSRQVLVGVDGSASSERALAYAVRRASRTGEEVVAVHAYQLPNFTEGGRTGARSADIDTTLIDDAERVAAELVAGVKADNPEVDLRSTAVVGRPGRVLARLSDDACLVVVGSRGRNAVQELVLGSVSQEVLYRAECPVVVVR
ncbi:universal stress protein [Marmoricola sp. RAF53]|uniref:universal stress protein n=1 Tax=Marmoricola sp. RAF53 TaxID=3233059 RepID=UPI003F9AAAD3